VNGNVQAQPYDFAFVAADRSRYCPIGVSGKRQPEMTSLQTGRHISGHPPAHYEGSERFPWSWSPSGNAEAGHDTDQG
jgi:hypothetical protein